MSSSSGHHTDDPPSTSDSMVKIQKGKVINPYFLCKDIHFTYLFHRMDEASKFLEDITFSLQWIPTCYRKLSLEPPLVDQVVGSVLSSVNPTLPLKSEVEVVNSVSSVVDPTLPLKSEVKVVDSVSSMVDPTLHSKSEFQVVNSDLSVVDPTLPLKREVQLVESVSFPPYLALSLESVKTELVSLT